MSSPYPKPNPIPPPSIFNPYNYESGGSYLTLAQANQLYLKLAGGTVSGGIIFNSTITIPTGASNSYVLTSDASGHATWQPNTSTIPNPLTNTNLQDSTCFFIDNLDATKKIGFECSTATANTTLTIGSNQTTSQTLNIPNITGTDAVAVLNLAQTFSKAQTIGLTGSPPTFVNNLLNMYDTQNAYVQANIQNLSNGTSASTDLVMTNNNGNDTAGYLDLGINSSGYTGSIGGASDAYLFSVADLSSNGGNLFIGTNSTSKSLYLYAGTATPTTATSLAWNGTTLTYPTGAISTAHTIINPTLQATGNGKLTVSGTGASANVLAMGSSTGITWTLPTSTSTLANLSSNQTFTGAITSSGGVVLTKAGQATVASSALYLNPASTAMSGANNYYYAYFNTPASTGSTTGTSSTVYIAGATTLATNNYALNVASGQTTIPNGTVGAPSLTFSTNKTTGLYSSASNNVDVAVSGVNKVNISSSGFKIGASGTAFNTVVNGSFTQATGTITANGIYNGTGGTALSFGITFSSTPKVEMWLDADSNFYTCFVQSRNITTTGCDYIIFNAHAVSSCGGTATIYWYAYN